MGGLFNLIKNLFSGIFSFLGGLLGGKKSANKLESAPKTRKSAGYFLEWDGASGTDSSTQPVQEESPVPAAVVEKAAPVNSESASKPVEKKSSKRSEQLAAAKNGASSDAPIAPVTQEAQPALVASTPSESTSAEFATKYLVPTSNGSRRRPGANMNSYLDMARNIKTPEN